MTWTCMDMLTSSIQFLALVHGIEGEIPTEDRDQYCLFVK